MSTFYICQILREGRSNSPTISFKTTVKAVVRLT
nr:MAG TPA: hypothetical protein [Caudoviricetes sp.]